MNLPVCLLVSSLVLLSVPVEAAVLVELSSIGAANSTVNAPTQNVFASNQDTSVNVGVGWRSDPSQTPQQRALAQSFLVGSQDVIFDKITLKTSGGAIPAIFQDNAEITFTLEIFSVPSASALPSTTGAISLSQQTGNFAGFAEGRSISSGNIVNSAYNYFTFDFENLTLAANGYYMVALTFTAGGTGYNIPVASNGGNLFFPNGTGAINNDNSGWSSSNDLYFYAQAVPEPATASLLLVGVLGAVWIRSRRAASINRA